MKIAVIIPHRKAGARLERCLQSLIRQPKIEGADFEFITIDDNDGEDYGQDQELAHKIRDFDNRVLPLLNENAPGVSGARNTGIQWALHRHADYITFLDADDQWTEDGARNVVEAINANEPAPIIELDHLRHYIETGQTKIKHKTPTGTYTIATRTPYWPSVWNKIIAAPLIERANLRFVEGLQYGEDERFIIDALAVHNEIKHDGDHIALMRWFDNKQSLSRTKIRGDLLDHIATLQEALEEYPDKPEIARNICLIIAEHWQSPTFLAKFGGGEL